MYSFKLGVVIGASGVALLSAAHVSAAGPIEPNAGQWKTWVISSGSQFRPSAPPDERTTAQELVEVRAAVEAARREASTADRISYWDTSWPGYRWQEIAIARQAKEPTPPPHHTWLFRVLALLSVAQHDATIATWDAKYAFNRPPPNHADAALATNAAMPRSPSYPSEHAAVAAASAGVLSYLFPSDASIFASAAEEAGRSRVRAGVAYPSDVQAGEELGRKVATSVIERAKADGSDKVSDKEWTGPRPTGPGYWTGSIPRLVSLTKWKPWVLASPDQFRSPPPPAHDSPQKAAELSEIKNFKHGFQHRRAAFFWNAPEILEWLSITNRKIFEYRWDDNAPRAANAVSLLTVTLFDTGIACYDGKYHYWAARPQMLDPAIVPLFTVPNHPTYPAAHACNFRAAEVVLTSLFPRNASAFEVIAKEGPESRIWAGIHFRSDLDAGQKVGEAVARLVVKEHGIQE